MTLATIPLSVDPCMEFFGPLTTHDLCWELTASTDEEETECSICQYEREAAEAMRLRIESPSYIEFPTTLDVLLEDVSIDQEHMRECVRDLADKIDEELIATYAKHFNNRTPLPTVEVSFRDQWASPFARKS